MSILLASEVINDSNSRKLMKWIFNLTNTCNNINLIAIPSIKAFFCLCRRDCLISIIAHTSSGKLSMAWKAKAIICLGLFVVGFMFTKYLLFFYRSRISHLFWFYWITLCSDSRMKNLNRSYICVVISLLPANGGLISDL